MGHRPHRPQNIYRRVSNEGVPLDIIALLKSAFMGLVEGITEWLPVSSTGHMILVDEFVKMNVSETFWNMFLVVIQLGAILAVAFVQIPKFARLARGEALALREALFIKAARVSGFRAPWIILHHVIHDCMGPIMVLATLPIGATILVAASLSFIGLGAQPPPPEWGAMVSTGRKFLLDQWWYPTFPGLFIMLTVIGFNILGDALRDARDPRMRGRK